MEKSMFQFLRGDNRKIVGVIVAIHKKDENTVKVGWSKCNKIEKKFDEDKGFKIATARALTGSSVKIPPSKRFYNIISKKLFSSDYPSEVFEVPIKIKRRNLREQYINFAERIIKYYKTVPKNNFKFCGDIDTINEIDHLFYNLRLE